MLLGLLLVAAALVLLVVVAWRIANRGQVSLGGTTETHSLDWLTAPELESLSTPAADRWRVVTLRTLAEVEALLDRLEAARVTEREVIILGDQSFAVRWRQPGLYS